MKFSYREHITPGDRETVRAIVESTGFFNAEELGIAVELVDERLRKGPESGYHFLFCEQGSLQISGYTCFGPIPGTVSSFDLYWIAVHRQFQGQGIGRGLLGATENIIRGMGGSRVYVETSSRDLYQPTQSFYERSGYTRKAFLEDFYAPGDGKIIYVRELY